jgi:hypothetical protein
MEVSDHPTSQTLAIYCGKDDSAAFSGNCHTPCGQWDEVAEIEDRVQVPATMLEESNETADQSTVTTGHQLKDLNPPSSKADSITNTYWFSTETQTRSTCLLFWDLSLAARVHYFPPRHSMKPCPFRSSSPVVHSHSRYRDFVLIGKGQTWILPLPALK